MSFLEIVNTLKRDVSLIRKSSFSIKLSILLSFLFVLICFGIFIYRNEGIEFSIVSLVLLVFVLLSYLVIFDILNLEIPEKFTNFLIASAVILNLGLGLAFGFKENIFLTDSTVLNNFIGGIVGAFVIASIVMITKEKGMGGGDIKILFLLGLFVGIEKTILTFLLAIYIALFASIPLILKKGTYKDIQIPFVPFLVFGAILAVVLGLKLEMLVVNYV